MRISLSLLASVFVASSAVLASTPLKNHADHFRKRMDYAPKPRTIEERAPVAKRSIERRASPYATEKSKHFAVNGTSFPSVPFDIGESYAGLLPISGDPDESRQLFFWFFPSENPDATGEITIWFNGGPGCSSLSGFLTENGKFTWEAGTLAPVENPYSWTNLTNMLWVEQPVGVGFTQGVPNITNEVELGLEFIGFYKQFVDTFNAHGNKVYLTGESYGGFYVPYIADAFITANDTKDYYNLKGVAINDPIIGDFNVQEAISIVPYADYWEDLFYLNETYKKQMHEQHKVCGFSEYFDKYYKFPPPQEPFVLPSQLNNQSLDCDTFDDVYAAILEVNPCFNIYHITETCPHPYSQLGIINPGDYNPPGAVVYFNRSDVQAALNAPVGTNWEQCTSKNVFGGATNNQSLSDTSVGPANNGVLKRVIEFTKNTFIGSGDLDYILNTNGTLLAIQNMTWGGLQGLQAYPSTPFYAPYHPEFNGGALAGAGYLGTWTHERGLTFYRTQLAGHELPGYTPGAAYRVLEVMLGRVSSLSHVSDFTTQDSLGDFNIVSNATAQSRTRWAISS